MGNEQTVRHRLALMHARLGRIEALALNERALAETRSKRSGWSVAEHVEHLLIVDRSITRAVARILAGEHDGEGKPTLHGRWVLAIGRVPRRRAEAPERVRPRGRKPHELRDLVRELRDSYDRFGSQIGDLAAATGTLRHPFFGALTPLQWLRFTIIHDDHHLRIIEDIRC